jgi:hypothetical protein
MAVVAKWLTHRIVAPTFVGSIPIDRPILWEYSQVVRHRSAKPLFPGSNPGTPSKIYFAVVVELADTLS